MHGDSLFQIVQSASKWTADCCPVYANSLRIFPGTGGATVFLLTKGLRAPDSNVPIGAAITGLAAVSVPLILAVLTVDLWLIHNASAQFDSSHSALRVAHLVGSIVSVTYFGLSPVLAVAFIDTGYHTLLFDDLAWFTGIATALGWIGFFTYLPTANRKNR